MRCLRMLLLAGSLLGAASSCEQNDPPGPMTVPDASLPHDGGRDSQVEPDAAQALEVKVGVPAGEDRLDFQALEAGQELRLQTFGQGGTHLMLAVRCQGCDSRAYVSMTLRNLETGAEAVSPAPVRPQLLLCDDEGNCDLVPLLAMTAGLVEADASRDGLEIEVIANVRSEDGREASASERAVLSTADL